MVEYKCAKHKSNSGFINEEGKWICWKCYEESPFYNPQGKIIDTYTKDNLTIRIVDYYKYFSVEVWDNETMIEHFDYRDLSSSTRRFKELISKVNRGET